MLTIGYPSLVLLLLLSLLSVSGSAQTAPEMDTPPPPGKLVDIGGYRLHIHTMGTGSPTVVLLSGAGDYSFVWSLVQPEVAQFARVCAYDRAGDAWSDLGPVPRTMKQEVYELHLLLKNAHLKPPYVLVGASIGGLHARLYADTYPGEVAGIVLVDSTHENTILGRRRMENGKFVDSLFRVRESGHGRPVPPPQTMKTSPPKPPTDKEIQDWEAFRKQIGPPKITPPFDRLPPEAQRWQLWARSHVKLSGSSDDYDYMGEEFQALYEARQKTKYPLGDIPLISLRAGDASDDSWTPEAAILATLHMTPDDWRKLGQRKAADLASLSSNSRWYVAVGSDHAIHLDDPQLVVFAIRSVVEAARKKTRLMAHGRE